MAAKRKNSRKKPATTSVYQLKITLLETDPPIWRRLQVSADTTLGDLNFVLQVSLGWTNSHLHRFMIGDNAYSDPRFELDEHGDDIIDEFAAALRDVAPKVGSRVRFEYDFGDGWGHDVVVEEITEADPGGSYPTCLSGARACPPEDCGGVWGYRDFLEAIGDPKHEEHEVMLEWVGGNFDAEAFDVEELNGRLISDVELLASWT